MVLGQNFLSKVHMYEQYVHWRKILVDFAKKIDKPDPEEYVDEGGWKARQGGNGIDIAERSIISYERVQRKTMHLIMNCRNPLRKSSMSYLNLLGISIPN